MKVLCIGGQGKLNRQVVKCCLQDCVWFYYAFVRLLLFHEVQDNHWQLQVMCLSINVHTSSSLSS